MLHLAVYLLKLTTVTTSFPRLYARVRTERPVQIPRRVRVLIQLFWVRFKGIGGRLYRFCIQHGRGANISILQPFRRQPAGNCYRKFPDGRGENLGNVAIFVLSLLSRYTASLFCRDDFVSAFRTLIRTTTASRTVSGTTGQMGMHALQPM